MKLPDFRFLTRRIGEAECWCCDLSNLGVRDEPKVKTRGGNLGMLIAG